MTVAASAHLAAATTPKKTAPAGPAMSSSSVIVVLGLELAGVSALTLAAGVNDNWGKSVTWFMVALWFIYLITDARNIISRFSTSLTKHG